jgi:predicted small secreted protein
MRKITLVLILISVTGCGTIGGAVSGAGQDLGRAGEYIRKI